MDKNIEVLQEVLDLLEEEKRKFYNLVNLNSFRIEEINSYLKEISKNEEDDFKVFSPRNAENRHRDQIEADIAEKKKCEDENIEYLKQIEYLKLLITKVNVVVENLNIDNDNVNKIPQNKILFEDNYDNETNIEKNSTVEVDLKNKNELEKQHISYQILNCVSFIISDAERAKIELTAIAEKMMEY